MAPTMAQAARVFGARQLAHAGEGLGHALGLGRGGGGSSVIVPPPPSVVARSRGTIGQRQATVTDSVYRSQLLLQVLSVAEPPHETVDST